MPPRTNPLKLNPLQLKTLTLIQELGRLIGQPAPDEAEGSLLVDQFPHAHGNHFHLGDAVVSTADANGLANPAGRRSPRDDVAGGLGPSQPA